MDKKSTDFVKQASIEHSELFKEKKTGLFLSIFAVLALLACITGVGLWGMDLIRNKAEIIVQNRLEKVQNVATMHQAARDRTLALQRMIILEDPFERDEQFLLYNKYGAKFVRSRLAFIEHELDGQEENLLKEQGSVTASVVPLQQQVIDLLLEERIAQAREVLVYQAVPLQDKAISKLAELLEYQLEAANLAVKEAEQAYQKGKFWILLMSLTAATIGLLITWLVYKRAYREKLETFVSEIMKANEAKSAFLANMSHEIRTPLTGIIGFAQISQEENKTTDDRLKAFKTIENSGIHLLSIINDILDLSKIEASKLEIENIEMSPLQVLEEVRALVEMQAKEKGLSFGVNYLFPLPSIIFSDPLRIKQIILNLCSNAIKFTDSGYININISTNVALGEMTFDVTDSGIGLSEEQVNRIFKAFEQADSTTTRRFGGTGLGLSISKKLSQMLGGDMTVTSKLGVGSRFSFTIKTGELDNEHLIQSADELPSNKLEIKAREEIKTKAIGKILLAEDTVVNQDLFVMYIEAVGASCDVVENGQEVLDKVAANQYDLIFMDMQMPVMDGITATKELRNNGYTGPIVALTANAMNEDKEACLAAGCDDFVRKPVDRDRLEKVIRFYLAESSPSTEKVESIFPEKRKFNSKMEKLRERFVMEGITGFLNGIHQAHDEKDFVQLKAEIHKLKGTGGNFGYPMLTEHCRLIEEEIRQKNTQKIKKMIDELDSMHQQIIQGLSSVRKTVE